MAYVIGIVSQKGGAGKSTLARLLARELAHNAMRVKIADLDTQQTTCTGWASDRAEAGIEPEIQVQPFGNLRTALAEAGRFDAYILDGRPHSSEQTIEIGRAAHVTVIPTGQTKDDLRRAVQLAHSLVDAGIDPSRIVFALVKTTRSTAEVSAARSHLEQTDYAVLDGDLPISTAYGIAHDAGKALTETAYPTLNEKAEHLAQADHRPPGRADRREGGLVSVNASALRKGAPPPRAATKSPIDADRRPAEGKNKPLQLMVPPDVFEAFSARAGQEFGFSKGSKSRLFLAMWEAYGK